MAMKKVGGPARNEMRSRATRASACSGSKRRTRTERSPAAPGTRTPLSRPEIWAIGAGIQHRVAWAQAVDPRHQRRLPAERAVPRVQHRLGDAGGARGEQDQRDVGGPAGAGAGRYGGAADGVGERGGVGEGLGAQLDHERRVDLAEGRVDVRRAERVQDGRPHRADVPAGPGQDGGGQTVGDLPGHGVAPPDAPFVEAARHRRHQGVRPGRRQPGGSVDHLPTTCGQAGRPGSVTSQVTPGRR